MLFTAAVTEERGAPFELATVELGELRPDELLVRVAAAGICHTDLIVRDQWYPVPLPAVLGHEGAGVVEDVGAAVTEFAPGDRVGLSFHSCGRCRSCLTGRPSYCRQFFEHNFGASRPDDGSSAVLRDGRPVHAHFFGQSSFATYAVANERNAVRLPDGVPLEVAAPFGCGIQTGAGAVLNVLRPAPGESLAVFGTGAVGLAAIAAAAVAGCGSIVAVDVRPERLALARDLGATDALDARDVDPVEAVRELTGGGVDCALEATGSPAVVRQAVDALAVLGTCGVVGAPAFGTEVALDVNGLLVPGKIVRGIVEGDSVPKLFLPTLFALWEQGRFPVDRMMSFYEFDRIDEAADDAEAGRAVKCVLRMS